MLEHSAQLGSTLERIAWHKSGIIKQQGYAYSVPQANSVLAVLQAEADQHDAEFYWIAGMDMGEYLGPTEHGLRMRLHRYGDVELSLRGRYQVENATLAVQGVGNLHSRLPGITHGSDEYLAAIRAGLASVVWPGRAQQLDEHPLTFLDGAINGQSARLLMQSLTEMLPDPCIAIIAVPDDKDYEGVYREVGVHADTVILTETPRNASLTFPPPDEAIADARRFNDQVLHLPTLAEAVDEARALAGTDGSILIVGTQSIVADAMALWGLSYEVI